MANSLYSALGGLHGLQNQSSLSSQMNTFAFEQEFALRMRAERENQIVESVLRQLRDTETSNEVLLLL